MLDISIHAFENLFYTLFCFVFVIFLISFVLFFRLGYFCPSSFKSAPFYSPILCFPIINFCTSSALTFPLFKMLSLCLLRFSVYTLRICFPSSLWTCRHVQSYCLLIATWGHLHVNFYGVFSLLRLVHSFCVVIIMVTCWTFVIL